MNISALNTNDKAVSATPLFKGGEGTVLVLQILKDKELKEHITKIPALLVCVEGQVVFENETGAKETLSTGDYVHIEPMVKHWVIGLLNSQLLLVK